MRRPSWRSTLAFYLLSMGSALGLGNLWRLPFVVGENGGGAFFLFYLLFAFLIGLPLLIAELIMGQKTGQSPLGVTWKVAKETGRPYTLFGIFSVILSLIVLSYYSVISGWVLHFLARFVTDLFSENVNPFSFEVLLKNGWLQILLTSVHLLMVIVVVSVGIQEGLEKWIRAIVPIFLVFVVLLLSKTLTLPTTKDVMRFLFYPDFSKMTLVTMNRALAHVFFTMSVGFGLMVSFGAYLKREEHLPTLGFRITMIDMMVSVIALLFVFPVAFQVSRTTSSDPILLFNVIPQFFQQMKGGVIFGILFFLCLYLASLNASLALMTSLLANIQSVKPKITRRQAVWSASIGILILTGVWVLIPGFIHHQSGPAALEALDNIAVNWMLPIVALGLLLTFHKAVSDQEKHEFFVDKDRFVSVIMEKHWRFVVTWLAPLLIALALALQIVG